jgi:hypothetical protein
VVSGVFVADKADLVVTCGGIMKDVRFALSHSTNKLVGYADANEHDRISRKTLKKPDSSRRSRTWWISRMRMG